MTSTLVHDDLRQMRIEMIQAVHERRTGLLPPSFSILEILYALRHHVMTDDDDFVLSKGHAALAQYAIEGRLEAFKRGELPGLTMCGSLGNGLPIALGKALWRKAGTVYCLIGDGESNEGSIWEAARVIAAAKLPVVVILDANGTHETQATAWAFEALGFAMIDIDGHNIERVAKTLKIVRRPGLVVAHTLKGKGVREMEAEPMMWHNRIPDAEQARRFVEELRNG